MINNINYGWVCPKCGSVYAPTHVECYKCSPNGEITSTDIAMQDYEKTITEQYGGEVKFGNTRRKTDRPIETNN